ncbi:DUF3761 domain-containing protein [Streptomyces hesseae]|uniref:DUF3761 domain-containing protein n=1 Tax=Streptomyces hesseae TaxID=3075519 RepID=A0ABU2SXZ7_9ACTN|nr:DUF3761 domain-containing protein [Streptomyces sp. DSM 40473]MDT0453727.1 DUF3761 domain-containing protein [Streptomyces sp. DSM 40473]
MLSKTRASTVGLLIAGMALTSVATMPAAQAATAKCAHHTTGVCKASSRHPRGATAQCKDKTYSYSARFSGTCSHHRGVLYWYK